MNIILRQTSCTSIETH